VILPSARPRIAIVGGGGAMGRLFARLLHGAAREIYLFDFWDATPNRLMLAKLLDELRATADAAGWRTALWAVSPTPGERSWIARPATATLTDTRVLLSLTPTDVDRDSAPPPRLAAPAADVVGLVEAFAAANPAGCTIFAGPPDDAPELLPRVDLTVLAIGIDGKSSLAEALRFYAPWLRPGSLVVDLGSTKTEALETLCREVDPRVGVLGAHPLFGPSVSDLTGLIVAVVDPADGRATSPWRDWFLDHLARHRFIVTRTSAQEHDDAMAFVQTLTHFVLLSFAYTFVRLNRDPADFLAFRTPVFEPLLYLAARVAHLARTSPDTYRSIQTHTTRPSARAAFLEAAHELLAAIESDALESAPGSPSSSRAVPLADLFLQYGSPWSPDQHDRRDRQRREHFLEMGARLVDGLNQLRQEVVAAAGQVRAIEEKRLGQPPRVVLGVVDLDLLDPRKQDVSARIRVRPVNLLLGRVLGEEGGAAADDHDQVIPLARARVLDDAELLDWLLSKGELVEKRAADLLVPAWFDRDVLLRLLKGRGDQSGSSPSRIWDVALDRLESRTDPPVGLKTARITFSIVLHPGELVATRRRIQGADAARVSEALRRVESATEEARRAIDGADQQSKRTALLREKDRLKRQRKNMIDQRTAAVDRAVRRETRLEVQRIYQEAVSWLTEHGCSPLR